MADVIDPSTNTYSPEFSAIFIPLKLIFCLSPALLITISPVPSSLVRSLLLVEITFTCWFPAQNFEIRGGPQNVLISLSAISRSFTKASTCQAYSSFFSKTFFTE